MNMDKIPVKSYSSKEIIKILEADGWKLKESDGDHFHFVHSEKRGKVTVTHPVKNIPKGTINSILKQAGLK